VDISQRKKVNGEKEGGGKRLIYFIYLHENRTMKLVEIILSRGRGVRENVRQDEFNQNTLLIYMEM
jgi:hypothetical protein